MASNRDREVSKPTRRINRETARENFVKQLDNARKIAKARFDTLMATDPPPVYDPDTELEASYPRYDNTGKWIPPKQGLRLSDLQVYNASKNLKNEELHTLYPYDFESNGNVRTMKTRLSKNPCPLVWAHGLPWIVVNRDTVPLAGSDLCRDAVAPTTKSDKAVAAAPSAWTVGLILAPPAFVASNLDHARQLEYHHAEGTGASSKYPKESRLGACDTMTTEHHSAWCYLPNTDGSRKVFSILSVPGYHIACGPARKQEIKSRTINNGKIGQLKDLRKRRYENIKEVDNTLASFSASDSEDGDTKVIKTEPQEFDLPAPATIERERDELHQQASAMPAPPSSLFPENAFVFASDEVSTFAEEIDALYQRVYKIRQLSEIFESAKMTDLLNHFDNWAGEHDEAEKYYLDLKQRLATSSLQTGIKNLLVAAFEKATTDFFAGEEPIPGSDNDASADHEDGDTKAQPAT